ncbi:MAG TPA: hypothetical protein VFS10_18205 [Pyrinomonadaceae bacterium]|nr:hypothetical protein [Pyrinomonadaceae bacterium]
MSDYLWDKTGEPDAEVERLEELLGGFGHKPRALELPAEAAPHVALSTQPRRFRPSLVAAAAIIFMVLAGAALVLLRQGGADVKQQASNPPAKETPPRRAVAPSPVENPPSPAAPKREEELTHGNAQGKKSLPPDFQAEAKERQGSPHASRQARRVVVTPEPRVVVVRHEPPSVEQQAAKQQLVYALRLASVKLNEVRKMTRGEESLRHSFNERNRIR